MAELSAWSGTGGGIGVEAAGAPAAAGGGAAARARRVGAMGLRWAGVRAPSTGF